MNILIIGSKGFIGSHFTSYFRKKNWTVFECDVSVDHGNSFYLTVDPVNSNYDNIFELSSYDICINCSGAANVSESMVNPSMDFRLNVVNLYSILDSLRKKQPGCKFINLSSAAVYGSPAQLPVSESDIPMPISPYGYHKRISEEICDQFHVVWEIELCSLRIFSAYGDGLKKQLFWDIYQKIKSSSLIELYGTGMESRDFIHISDLANAVDLIIKNASFKSDKINVANGTEVFIDEVVKKYLDILAYNGKLIFNGMVRMGDPLNWKADLTKLNSYGYKQSVDMTGGLEQYANWLQQIE